MAISLGSLFIELKANTGQFLQGMTKAATNSKAFGRDLQSSLSKVGSLFAPLGDMGSKLASVFDAVGAASGRAFSQMGKSGLLIGTLAGVSGGAAALGATLFGLAEHASEVGAKIFEASEKTGISAAQMSGLMAIAKETGGDFDSLTTSLARAGANLETAIIDPGGKAGKILSQVLGGAKNLTAEGLRPMGDRLQDVMKHIFAMNDVGERNVALSALLGRGWMANVETLKILAEQGYGPAEAAARRFGLFFDDTSARQAKNFQVALGDLKAELSGLGLTIGQSVTPAIQDMLQRLHGMGANLMGSWFKLGAVGAAIAGNFDLAKKMWAEANEEYNKSQQAQTDFLVHTQNLTEGVKAQAEATGHLTEKVKELSKAEREGYTWPGATYITEPAYKVPLIFSERPGKGEPLAELPLQQPGTMNAGGQMPENPWAGIQPHVSDLQRELKAIGDQMVADGKDTGDKLASIFLGTVDKIEDKFAQMVVKGRANFRDILPAMEEQLVKVGLQKGVSTLLGHFGIGGGHKPDGTAGNPLHVIMAGAGGAASGAASAIPGVGSSVSSMSGALGGFFSEIFGGFMAEGGDVTPGRAYVVGEKHPEFFVPRTSGTVSKGLVGGNQTSIVMHVHGVSDADSFRRSHAQIAGELHRTISMAHARNS
jgi:hypothetical protein